ncbi:MAG: MOSC domain-containing protein [Chthoniobacteraceae bacterium]
MISVTFRIKHLYLSPGHNYFGHHEQPPGEHPMIERAEVCVVAGRGIEGDRFFDFKADYKGQVTFFADEVYEDLCARLDAWDKPPSVFRRNIITRGVDLNELIDREFESQGVRFLGTGECTPCYWMDQAFGEGAEAALTGRGGLRAKILSDGVLRAEAG